VRLGAAVSIEYRGKETSLTTGRSYHKFVVSVDKEADLVADDEVEAELATPPPLPTAAGAKAVAW
jgi:hypothetical protein